MCNRETSCSITILLINLPNLETSITYLGTVEARQRPWERYSWTQIMVPLHREGLGSIFTDFSAQEGCSAAGQAERGHFPWLGGTLCNTNREVEGGRWVQRVGREKGHDVPGPFTAAPTQPVSAGSLHSAPGPQSIIVPRHAGSTCGTAFWEPK